MVLSGSRIWSAGHEDDLICFGRPVGSCRDRRLCQRCSGHEDFLGAAGTPVLLSIGWAASCIAHKASARSWRWRQRLGAHWLLEGTVNNYTCGLQDLRANLLRAGAQSWSTGGEQARRQLLSCPVSRRRLPAAARAAWQDLRHTLTPKRPITPAIHLASRNSLPRLATSG